MTTKSEICVEFQEHPNWTTKNPPKIGVTFDGWCSKCGFKLENKQFSNGVGIEGNGRRLERVISIVFIDDKIYRSDGHIIMCSVCCPAILDKNDE